MAELNNYPDKLISEPSKLDTSHTPTFNQAAPAPSSLPEQQEGGGQNVMGSAPKNPNLVPQPKGPVFDEARKQHAREMLQSYKDGLSPNKSLDLNHEPD